MEPQWKHNCIKCQFLGRHGTEDVYIHTRDTMIEVVIRYSDNGPDYWRGSSIKPKDKTIPKFIQFQAYFLAHEEGYAFFGLADNGIVYKYDYSTKMWVSQTSNRFMAEVKRE